MSAEEEAEDVGSLRDELRRLGVALGDWSAQREPDTADRADESTDPLAHRHVAEGGDATGHETPDEVPAACRVCPICQLIAVARGERSEALDGLLTAAAGLVTALTTYVEKQGAGPSAAPPEPPAERTRVQRIDLT